MINYLTAQHNLNTQCSAKKCMSRFQYNNYCSPEVFPLFINLSSTAS